MRRRSRLRNRLASVNEAAFASVDHESRQNARGIGARIDSDSVRPLFDIRRDRVSMDDDKAVIRLIEQERLANPPEVRLILLLERNAGADAGMDEEIIAEAARIDEASKELDVLFRNRVADRRERRR